MTGNYTCTRTRDWCESQLLITAKDFQSAIAKIKQVDITILDIFKAFDMIPYHRLMVKLNIK